MCLLNSLQLKFHRSKFLMCFEISDAVSSKVLLSTHVPLLKLKPVKLFEISNTFSSIILCHSVYHNYVRFEISDAYCPEAFTMLSSI